MILTKIFFKNFNQVINTFFFFKSLNDTNVNILYFYIFLIVQILRYRIIYELGKYWTTRILVINQPLIQTWMFRYLKHPNYIVVFLEVILICLFFDDLLSLVIFSTINSILIYIRVMCEEKANKFRHDL